jgi:hypothetical protein
MKAGGSGFAPDNFLKMKNGFIGAANSAYAAINH